MDGKRPRDLDDEANSPSGKRPHHEAEVKALSATADALMQVVAHEAFAWTGGGGFSAINSANRMSATAAAPTTDTNSLANSSLGDCHCTSTGQTPIESMSDITRCFKNAVVKAWDRRSPTYASVHVLLIYWEGDDNSVKAATVQLEDVFRTTYRFATEIFSIQSVAASDGLYAKIDAFFAGSDSPGDLAIVYYAGEIVANCQAGEAPIWAPHGQSAATSIASKPIQAACENANCDVLLLFDFCNAYHYPLTQASYGAARPTVIEVLDAPGSDVGEGAISFTRALVEELATVASEDSVQVESLKTRIATRMAMVKPRGRGRPPKESQTKSADEQLHLPKHSFLFQRRSIVLSPLPAEPQVVLCLRVLSGSLDIDRWGKWIYNATTGARDAVNIEGFHSGFSTVIVLRVPVSEWACFSECPAGSFVGYTTIGDIDPVTLEKIDADLASKLWPNDEPAPQIAPPAPSVATSATDMANPLARAMDSYTSAADAAIPVTTVDGDPDGAFPSRMGPKRVRKALPTERKILPSEPSPTTSRKKEYLLRDEHKTNGLQSPPQRQSQPQPLALKAHEHAVEVIDATDKNALLAAAAQRPFKISIKLAGQTHVCKECKSSFKDADSLQNHVRKLHTRPFHCVFHWAGCDSTFASKNEWKRHVMSQHILLQYWVCQVDMCSKVANRVSTGGGGGNGGSRHDAIAAFSLPNGAIFNRKDLFTQHLRRMHTPPQVKKLQKQAKQGVKMPNHVSIQEWENRLKDLQQDGLKPRCRLPDYMMCPAQGCEIDFHGNNAWDDRMEHVARHLEAASAGREPTVIFGGTTDMTLTDWATRPEVGIAKRVGPNTWHLDNPLRPEIMAWTEDVEEHCSQEGQRNVQPAAALTVMDVAEEDANGRRIGRESSGAGIPVN